jgi:hypothetical protein
MPSPEDAPTVLRPCDLDRGQVEIAAAVARLDRERMIADCARADRCSRARLIDPGDVCR